MDESTSSQAQPPENGVDVAELAQRLSQLEERERQLRFDIAQLREQLEKLARSGEGNSQSITENSPFKVTDSPVENDLDSAVPYFDPESALLEKIYDRLRRRSCDAVDLKFYEHTFHLMQGIGRSGIVDLTALSRPEVVSFGELLEAPGHELHVNTFTDKSGYGPGTIGQSTSGLRNALAFTCMEIAPFTNGRVSLAAKRKDSFTVPFDMKDNVEGILRRALENNEYNSTDNVIDHTTASVLRGIVFVIQALRDKKTFLRYNDIADETRVKCVQPVSVAKRLANIFPFESTRADTRTDLLHIDNSILQIT